MIRGARKIKLRELVKSVKILPTGTQFNGASPTNITLKAVAVGFTAASYAWYKGAGATVVGTNQNFVIANNQVSTVESYRVLVKDNKGQSFEDTISITKVTDGSQGIPGKLPVQREWKAGDVYRNNDSVIDYIYHRATNTWWRLKDGYNNVTAQANPGIEFIQLNSLEHLAVNLLIAENANIAGFVFKDGKMVSQTPSTTNPNLTLDGINGFLKALAGQIGEFDIHTGLEYDKEGVKLVDGSIKSYKHLFKFDKDGLQLIRDDWYTGAFCYEDPVTDIPYCISGNSHNVKYEVSTGGVDYYLKIFGEGKYDSFNYKAALWIQAVGTTIPAILIERGGIALKKGSINIGKGHVHLEDGSISMYKGDIAGVSMRVRTVNSTITISQEVYVYAYNTTGTITIRLPINPYPGRTVYVKRTDLGGVIIDGNGIAIQRSASTTSTITIAAQGDMMMIVFAGTNWQMNKMGI